MQGSLATLPYLLAVVGAGMSVAFQQVLNGRLRLELGSAWWAGFVSYFVGTLAMLAVILVTREPWLSGTMIGRTAPLSWIGGVFGAIFIATVIFTLPRLGAAVVIALLVVGQMLAALAFDHFGVLGIAQQSATPLRLAGAALLVLGVVLIRA